MSFMRIGPAFARPFAPLLLLVLVAGNARAADFDLCVRGTSLETTRTAHLKLSVDGADVAPFASRLGAALANRRFWNSQAEKVYGTEYDPDLCGPDIAEEHQIAITLNDAQAQALAAEATRGMGEEFSAAVDHVLGGSPVPVTQTAPGPDAAKGHGEEIRDAQGNLVYNVLRIFYATNRGANPAAPVDERFGGDRGPLSFGSVEVTVPKSHRIGSLEAPSLLKLEFTADPKKHVILKSVTPLDPGTWRAQIGKRARGMDNPGILVFVHGYNSSFADAARRAGQLAFDLNFAGATVLFSWPSRAEVVQYTVDEQNAEWSVPDMQAVLESLSNIAPGTPIYVIAHSMGNRVLTRGFKALVDADKPARREFKQMVLAAPDVDADVFRRDIAPAILGKVPRVTLYASSNDKALMASRDLHGGYHRLGESGKDLVVLPNLDTVDASMVSTEFLGHSYFGDSRTVVDDLKYVIHESLKPQERERFSLEPVRDLAVGVYWRFKGLPAAAPARAP